MHMTKTCNNRHQWFTFVVKPLIRLYVEIL